MKISCALIRDCAHARIVAIRELRALDRSAHASNAVSIRAHSSCFIRSRVESQCPIEFGVNASLSSAGFDSIVRANGMQPSLTSHSRRARPTRAAWCGNVDPFGTHLLPLDATERPAMECGTSEGPISPCRNPLPLSLTMVSFGERSPRGARGAVRNGG